MKLMGLKSGVVGVACAMVVGMVASPAWGQAGFAFVENRGQWDAATEFLARGGPMVARFEKDAILLRLHDRSSEDKAAAVVVRMVFEGARDDVTLHGAGSQPGVYNFFVGDDRSRWRTDVSAYSEVLWRGLYDGVDLRVRQKDGQLEYDVMLSPGADLAQVVIRCEGIDGLEVAPNGNLVMHTVLGPVHQTPPTTWYELADGERQPVECRFCKIDETRYGFDVPGLDPAFALVIDPGLVWSTYLGGEGQDTVRFANGIAVNAAGEVLVAGRTRSADFPVTVGAYDTTHNSPGLYDAFICKFDSTGQLLWCTFLGGSDDERINSVIPDGTGGVIVGGNTSSADFPTTPGAYDTTHNGGVDAFVAHLDPSLAGTAQLVYSTLVGDSGTERFADLSLDASGVVTAVGHTDSFFFPTTPGAYATTLNGGFDVVVIRLDPSLDGAAQLTYSTFLGGTIDEFSTNIAVNKAGTVTVAGHTFSPDFPTTVGAYSETFNGPARDAFVSRLNLNRLGPADLAASTFLGGSGDENGNAMSVDESGVVTVAGWATSPDFPTMAGAYQTTHNGPVGGQDVYVSKLDGTLSTLLASTFVGGASSNEGANTLSLGSSGIVTVAGFTTSTDYPTTFGAFDTTYNGFGDGFVTRLNSGLTDLVYSTYLGGFLNQDVVQASATAGPGRVAVGGSTASSSFPTTAGAFDETYNGAGDGFVAVLNLCPWDCTSPGDGSVGITDFLLLLGQWGGPGTCDFDDGGVGITDFLTLLANWGACP